MIFVVSRYSADTCGNYSSEGVEYLESNSLVDLWTKIGKPNVCGYEINKKWIRSSRTPEGKGYGIWESNPNFDWERDLYQATAFEVGGFSGYVVREIKLTPIESFAN
ncbi:MAG: hypothetical protein R3213_11670 [Flavobacteriaceae bacterium]|nr:hypothetical protein [Flavobacteriaceae bacterium]